MNSQGLSLLKSYQHVKNLRSLTQPNSNFLDQLGEYERFIWISKYGEEKFSLEETKTWLNSILKNISRHQISFVLFNFGNISMFNMKDLIKI